MKYLAAALVSLALQNGFADAQSVTAGVDLTSPAMTEAEMTRAEVEAMIARSDLDFTRKLMNGLDLSGLDLSNAVLRAARLNKANLAGTDLSGALMDQAWLLHADLSGADLSGASLFQTQFGKATLAGADASGSRAAADFTGADLTGADFTGADFSADMKNQSMGLMRGVLRSARAEGANFAGARMNRADMEFAKLGGANFEGADLMAVTMGGADLSGANVAGANFRDADVTSTRLINLGGIVAGQLDQARNLDRAFRD